MDRAGLSAAELAAKTGLTESAISLLRSGRREPSYRSLQRLTGVLPGLAQTGVAPSPFDSIEDAIADIRAGKMVVVLDDEDRENEGDLIMAAQMITPEARHEIDVLGAHFLRGHDEVAFVLAILVVHDHHHAPGGDVGEDFFDGVERLHVGIAFNRST